MIFSFKSKLFLKLLIILNLLVFVSYNSNSQVKIYPKLAISDTIDFGMRFFQNDEVTRIIVIENNSDDTLYMGNVAPTFATVEAQGYGDTHLAFDKSGPSEILFPPSTKKEINLKFFNHPNLIQEKGPMGAFLYIGLSRRLNDPTSLISQDTFFLYGRASEKIFTQYDNNINFDSTFINSNRIIERNIHFRNNSTKNFIKLTDLEYNLFTSITNGIEFLYEEPNFPISLASRTEPGAEPELIKIRYAPKDRGFDSCRFIFKADIEDVAPDTITDYIVFDTTTVTGFGVGLEYEITNSNYNFSNDDELTIELGDVRVNEVNQLNLSLLNKSNTTINIDSIFTLDSLMNIESDIANIDINKSVDFNLDFKVTRRGLFNQVLFLKTDFENRNINGYEDVKHGYLKIKLIGKGIEPSVKIPFDTLDIGTITYFGDCNKVIDYDLDLRNTGNDILEIKDYYISDAFNFSLNLDKQILSENEQFELNFNFDPPNKNNFQDYTCQVTLITNISPPNDTLKFYITASFVRTSETELAISEIKFKPGNIVSVPIILNYGNIENSNRFSSTLSYNNELIRYSSIVNKETASENSDNLNSIIEDNGKLYVNLFMPSNSYFNASDTLCILNFDTFIAKDKSTSFIIENSFFGDNDCENIIPIKFQSGILTADSIPNIDNIYYNFTNSFNIYPNPTNNELNIDLIDETNINNTELKIFDIYGNIVFTKIINNKYSKINIGHFNTGVYYINIDDNLIDKIIVY